MVKYENTRESADSFGARTDIAKKNTGWIFALFCTAAIAALVSLTPVLPTAVREIVMNLFSGVCHQLPHRSPYVDGIQLAVCHRCMGIYWALPVAALVYRGVRGFWPIKGRLGVVIMIAAAVPAGIDWIGDVIGWWENTPGSRVLTGSIFGLVAGYFLTRAVSDMVSQRRKRKNP